MNVKRIKLNAARIERFLYPAIIEFNVQEIGIKWSVGPTDINSEEVNRNRA